MRPLVGFADDDMHCIRPSGRMRIETLTLRVAMTAASAGCQWHQEGPVERVHPGAKLKPRWDVHLSGDDDQLGCAGKSLSSVLGE